MAASGDSKESTDPAPASAGSSARAGTAQATAERALHPDAAAYIAAVAGETGESGADEDDLALSAETRAWHRLAVVPRMLRPRSTTSTATVIAGHDLAAPLYVAPTAGHRLAHPDAEHASARAAAEVGALYLYSSSASVEVSEFGRAATGPWWAQVYLMIDRGLSRDYVGRAVAAGASALVLTVDNPGAVGDAPFRSRSQGRLTQRPGNFPGLTWQQMSAGIDPDVLPKDIAQLAEASRLPVWVKGILHPDDADMAIGQGAAGIVVSNHGRRQLPGVITVADALPAVAGRVDGRVPVLVDGGVRSGLDVLRALASGADAVGVGRPVLWALAANGEQGAAGMLATLADELKQAMAGAGTANMTAIRAAGHDLLSRPDLRSSANRC